MTSEAAAPSPPSTAVMTSKAAAPAPSSSGYEHNKKWRQSHPGARAGEYARYYARHGETLRLKQALLRHKRGAKVREETLKLLIERGFLKEEASG